MGTLRSASDCTGLQINGVTLGEPTFSDAMPALEAEPLMFAWDDSRLPDGVIEDNGTITLDEIEVV
jgi:hypothetical protein